MASSSQEPGPCCLPDQKRSGLLTITSLLHKHAIHGASPTATAVIQSSWPTSGPPSRPPASRSHTHTIRSLPPDTAIGRPPSSPTATALTVPLWPSNGSYSSPLESRSHTRTVASWLPETTIGRVVGERIDIAVLQSSCQPRLQDRGRPPGVQRAIRRAPPLAPTLNRQQCLPGLALAPEDTAGTASRLRPAATRRVRALAVREAVGGLVTPSLCNCECGGGGPGGSLSGVASAWPTTLA